MSSSSLQDCELTEDKIVVLFTSASTVLSAEQNTVPALLLLLLSVNWKNEWVNDRTLTKNKMRDFKGLGVLIKRWIWVDYVLRSYISCPPTPIHWANPDFESFCDPTSLPKISPSQCNHLGSRTNISALGTLVTGFWLKDKTAVCKMVTESQPIQSR